MILILVAVFITGTWYERLAYKRESRVRFDELVTYTIKKKYVHDARISYEYTYRDQKESASCSSLELCLLTIALPGQLLCLASTAAGG